MSTTFAERTLGFYRRGNRGGYGVVQAFCLLVLGGATRGEALHFWQYADFPVSNEATAAADEEIRAVFDLVYGE